MEIIGQTLHFWTGLLAGILILVHIPSCDTHWAEKLKPFSDVLQRHHMLTLRLATLFALLHITLSLIALFGGVRI